MNRKEAGHSFLNGFRTVVGGAFGGLLATVNVAGAPAGEVTILGAVLLVLLVVGDIFIKAFWDLREAEYSGSDR